MRTLLITSFIFIFIFIFTSHSTAQNTVKNLNDCIIYAISNNYEVLNELQRRNLAEVEQKQAYWAYFPTINATTDIATTFYNLNQENNTYKQNVVLGNEYGIEAKMPIYVGGKLEYHNSIAKKNREKIEFNLQSIQDTIAKSTMIAYIEVLYNSQVLELHKRMVENYRYQKDRLERMYHLGESSISDLSQIKAALSKEELEVSKTMLAYDNSLIKLKRIMNFPVTDTLIIEKDIPIDTLYYPNNKSGNEMNLYLMGNPNTQKLQKDVEINQDALKIAKHYYFPSVYMNGVVGSNFSNPIKNKNLATTSWKNQINKNLSYAVGISIVIPIFNGFQAKHEILKAKSNLAISNQNFTEVKKQIEAIILQLESELYALENQRKLSLDNLDLTRIANSSLTRKYQEGAISLIDLQSSNNQLLEAELQYLYLHLNHQIKIRVLNHYKGIPYIR